MSMPGYTAESALYRTSGRYLPVAGGFFIAEGQAVIPQQFAACKRRTLCSGAVLWARDYCCRHDGSVFTSLWFVNGVCFGIWDDGEQAPCPFGSHVSPPPIGTGSAPRFLDPRYLPLR